MNKICTTVEQSKKLIDIGINVDTADMYYFTIIRDYPYSQGSIKTIAKIMDGSFSSIYDTPAWSLSALLGLLPFHIIEKNNRFEFYQVKGFNKQGETYRFRYKTNKDFFLFETSLHNDVVDAAFEMICWLKENGKI